MPRSQERGELRCVCKALLAQATADGLTILCRRCRRTLLIPYGDIQGQESLVRFVQEWRRREVARQR